MQHLLRARQTWLIVAIAAAAAMILATWARPAKADPLHTVCDVEGSAGLGVAKTNISEFATDLGGVGALAGLGLGCDLQSKQWVVGAMGRASLMDVSGKLLGDISVKDTELFEVAARAGVRIHEKYTLYGLAGYSWEDLKVTSASTTHPNGLLLGGGLDFHVSGPIYSRLEYTWHDFDHVNVFGSKVEPNLHVVRIGAVWKFNDPVPPVADDAPAPKRAKKACDPKMMNC